MMTQRIDVLDKPPEENDFSSIGGVVRLPGDSEWPLCKMCGDRLVLFFQVMLAKHPRSGFRPGSLLQVFACRTHDDIAGTIYSDYKRFDAVTQSEQLPDDYWSVSDGHYLVRLLPPNAGAVASDLEPRLIPRGLRLQQVEDDVSSPLIGLKLYGEPSWQQDPQSHRCSCGGGMKLLLQVPEGFGFDKTIGAPEQPNSFSHRQYCLFLGNELYLQACENQCHPQALLPVLQ
jgi:hypothetical protein